jgi:hypothetical protein
MFPYHRIECVSEIANPWSGRKIKVIADAGVALDTGAGSHLMCTAITIAAQAQALLIWNGTDGC